MSCKRKSFGRDLRRVDCKLPQICQNFASNRLIRCFASNHVTSGRLQGTCRLDPWGAPVETQPGHRPMLNGVASATRTTEHYGCSEMGKGRGSSGQEQTCGQALESRFNYCIVASGTLLLLETESVRSYDDGRKSGTTNA